MWIQGRWIGRIDRTSHRRGSGMPDDAVASYNGDHVIHFNHPTWRGDRNDPATATRVDGRRQSSPG
jgi:hypothetical protein